MYSVIVLFLFEQGHTRNAVLNKTIELKTLMKFFITNKNFIKATYFGLEISAAVATTWKLDLVESLIK